MSNPLVLFEKSQRPRWHRAYGLRETWWTWSSETRRFLISHRSELEALRLAALQVLPNGYPMAVLPVEGRRLRALLEAVLPLTRALASRVASPRPFFFRDLIGHGVSGPVVSHFGALLARSVNDLKMSEIGPAMFVPPNPSPVRSDFSLHSDLFPRRRLPIIYDQVRAPEWAAALLLPWSRAFGPLKRASVSTQTKSQIRRLLSSRTTDDGIDGLFHLLYDDYSPRGERIVELLNA